MALDPPLAEPDRHFGSCADAGGPDWKIANQARPRNLSDELAALGRVDIGYFGDDAGINDSQLSLTSMGRLRDSGGGDTDTVWRIRNTGDTLRTVTLASVIAGYSQSLTIMSHTDAFVASPVVAGSADHRLVEATRAIQSAVALTTVFSDVAWSMSATTRVPSPCGPITSEQRTF